MEKRSEENLGSFYEDVVWKERLQWTGCLIPVRVKYKGVYIEAFIGTVPKPKENGTVNVRLLLHPFLFNTAVEVSQSEVYPSARKLTKFDDNLQLVDERREEYIPPPLDLPEDPLKYLSEKFPGSLWTKAEVAAAYGREEMDIKGLEKGQRFCMITSKLEKVYTAPPTTFPENDSIYRIRKDYRDCQRCQLGVLRAKRSASVVIGTGPTPAKGFILAESPWEKEERDKIPLHPNAPAGKAFTKALELAGSKRSDWFITNAVCCRPLLDPSAPLSENKPSEEHVKACSSRLKRTLRVVSPKVVVLLGKHAYFAWFGAWPDSVLKNVGWVHPTDNSGKAINYMVYFLPHPSFVARSNDEKVFMRYVEHWRTIIKEWKKL